VRGLATAISLGIARRCARGVCFIVNVDGVEGKPLCVSSALGL
jgi:hypothetical protein